MSVTFEKIFGKYVKGLRDATGETQEEFGRRMRIARSTISAIECSRRDTNIGHINQIAAGLGMHPSKLLHALADVAVELEKQAIAEATIPWRPVGGSGQSFVADDIAAKLPPIKPVRRGRPPKKK